MFFTNRAAAQQKELASLEKTESRAENTLYPGQNTCCIHFEIKSSLGWIAWKDREAALYILLERAFSATKCDLKIDDNLATMGMEIEIPHDQEDKFMKAIKSKTLAREIDKLHGIEPALCSWIDAKILNLRKTGGSTNPNEVGTSSIESIRKRIEMLEKCSETRTREVAGIKDMAISIREELNKRFDSLVNRIDMKVYERCGSKFDAAEYKIMKVLKDELAFLASPTVFKHPPEGVEHFDSGAKTFLTALNATLSPKPGAKTPNSNSSNHHSASLASPAPSSNSTRTQNPSENAHSSPPSRVAQHVDSSLGINGGTVYIVAGNIVPEPLPIEEKIAPSDQPVEGQKRAIVHLTDESQYEMAVSEQSAWVDAADAAPVPSKEVSKEEKRSNSLPPPLQIGSGDLSSVKEDFRF